MFSLLTRGGMCEADAGAYSNMLSLLGVDSVGVWHSLSKKCQAELVPPWVVLRLEEDAPASVSPTAVERRFADLIGAELIPEDAYDPPFIPGGALFMPRDGSDVAAASPGVGSFAEAHEFENQQPSSVLQEIVRRYHAEAWFSTPSGRSYVRRVLEHLHPRLSFADGVLEMPLVGAFAQQLAGSWLLGPTPAPLALSQNPLFTISRTRGRNDLYVRLRDSVVPLVLGEDAVELLPGARVRWRYGDVDIVPLLLQLRFVSMVGVEELRASARSSLASSTVLQLRLNDRDVFAGLLRRLLAGDTGALVAFPPCLRSALTAFFVRREMPKYAQRQLLFALFVAAGVSGEARLTQCVRAVCGETTRYARMASSKEARVLGQLRAAHKREAFVGTCASLQGRGLCPAVAPDDVLLEKSCVGAGVVDVEDLARCDSACGKCTWIASRVSGVSELATVVHPASYVRIAEPASRGRRG